MSTLTNQHALLLGTYGNQNVKQFLKRWQLGNQLLDDPTECLKDAVIVDTTREVKKKKEMKRNWRQAIHLVK
jgi:hypothetical protein